LFFFFLTSFKENLASRINYSFEFQFYDFCLLVLSQGSLVIIDCCGGTKGKKEVKPALLEKSQFCHLLFCISCLKIRIFTEFQIVQQYLQNF
jgi:hypothetical protein